MTATKSSDCYPLRSVPAARCSCFRELRLEGFVGYYNQQMIDAQVKRNKRRYVLQRIGLALLMASFFLAGLSVWYA